MKKIWSILLCFIMLFTCIPIGIADASSNNADLSSLVVDGYDLDPVFNAETTEYTVSVPNVTGSVYMIATTADSSASLKINDTAAISGSGETVDSLAVGDNTVVVEVTAQDGTTVNNYTVTINRAAAAANPLPQTPAEYAASDYGKYAARMAVGEAHIAVININGAVGAGGSDTFGQCSTMPTDLNAVKVKAVAAGSYHTLALREDGRVFAWGKVKIKSNKKEWVTIPAGVEEVQGHIKLIAAGASMSAVVTDTNNVIIWGFNSNNLATIPAGLTDITALALSNNCAVALTATGNVTVWGANNCTTLPEGLNGNAVAISVGMNHWLALKKDGSVTITGDDNGQLYYCKNIKNQTNVRAIVGGWQYAGAILSDGSVKGWGRTPEGTVSEDVGQELIPASANIKALSCTVSGGTSMSPITCAMQEDGNIKIVAADTFTTAPITDQFNFLTIPSNNVNLSGLEVAGYSISPVFDSTTITYTVNVPNDLSSVDIKATTADSGATLKIKGTAATSGAAWTVDSLVEGNNLIPVEVTGADFTTTKTYNLTIKRAGPTLSNNADLCGLTVAAAVYDMTPAFDAAITEYTVNVPNDLSSVDITATTADSGATLKIKGAGATSGAARTVNNLGVGNNAVAVEVTAKDETTVKTYNLTIKRAGPTLSNNADLCGLTVAAAVYDMTPAFDAAITEYTINIPNDITSINITATTADSNATLKINGAAGTSGSAQTISNLIVGDNAVAVAVTAKDGTTVKTYTITIKRALSASLDDSSLASLTVESVINGGGSAQVAICGIYPKFSSTRTEGIVDVANRVAEVRITAQPTSSKATLAINGKPAAAGVATVINAANLAVGDNIIPIKVTAANGSQLSYTLHLKMVSAEYALPALPQTPQAYQESDYVKYARRLAIGYKTVLAVKKNGTVISWGEGSNGSVNMPADLDNVVAVASGHKHSLALKADGMVVAWGEGYQGCTDIPAGLCNVADISAGQYFSAALDKNGQVYAWGYNNYDQCKVPDNLGNVVDIQCGGVHMLALKSNGTVAAWGSNDQGQCDVPAGLDHVVAITADSTHSAALKDDGTMVIWGGKNSLWHNVKNTDLQYFKGISASNRYITGLKWDGSMVVLAEKESFIDDIGVPLQPEQEILAVISSNQDEGILALNKVGTLAAWGDTKTFAKYDIPAGLNIFADDPAPYSGPSPDIPQTPVAYAASDYALAAARVCPVMNGIIVLNMDGTVKLAVSAKGDYDYTMPEGLTNVTAIASSLRTLMALKEDGKVVVWGYDGDNQSQVPANLGRVTAIATGAGTGSPYCLALQTDGTVAAWGGNTYNQCTLPAGLNNVTAIAAGNKHCLALKADGTVAAWGNNDYGQCNAPTGLNNVARIYTNYNADFSLALKNDGTVVAWGSNQDAGKKYYCGQCDVPEGLSGVVDIAIIDNVTCAALKSNGTVVVWGNNYCGKRNVPSDLYDVAAVASANGVVAIKTNGSVVNWGYGYSFSDLLAGLSKALTISRNTTIYRDGSLQYFNSNSSTAQAVNAQLTGLNVLSGHYFAIKRAELLSPAGQSISSVASQAGYRVKASVANNNAATTAGLTIIQVRGGSSATGSSGGQVLGCVGLAGDIPVTGSTASSDFTMPAGISGTAYVDVFVWDGWDTMVPRAAANQNLSFTVSN